MIDDELLDVVDDSDNVIGTINRSDYQAPGQGYLRAVGVLLMNDNGKLWIPVRNKQKTLAPNSLDFSAGEHVGSGESYIDAAVRGLKEELRIDTQASSLIFLGDMYPTNSLPYFHKLYLYRTNETPNFNPLDYQSFRWMDKQALLKEIACDIRCKEALKQSQHILATIDVKEYQ
jgi:isopentenyldiphosphate isomerase